MDDDADALALALGASKLGNEIIVHCPVIRPELVAELQEIEIGVMSARCAMAPNADALAFVNAVLDGVALHGEGGIARGRLGRKMARRRT